MQRVANPRVKEDGTPLAIDEDGQHRRLRFMSRPRQLTDSNRRQISEQSDGHRRASFPNMPSSVPINE